MHTVKKDGYMGQCIQTIGKNVYTVKGKSRYLRKKLIIKFYYVFVPFVK